jgi:cell shape-determining protein MreD
MTAIIVAYLAGSLFVLRVIYDLILTSEYMSPGEKAWRAVASFVLWPLLWVRVLGQATINFFLKGTYPQ